MAEGKAQSPTMAELDKAARASLEEAERIFKAQKGILALDISNNNQPKRHTDTYSIPDDATPSKVQRKFKSPEHEKLYTDPELKPLYRKIVEDPAFRRMRKQIKYFGAGSTSKKFDCQVYLSAAKEYLNNKELMDAVEHIRNALEEDPSKPRLHPAYRAIIDEVTQGGHAVRERYFTEPELFPKLVEALRLSTKCVTASSDDVTSLNEVKKPGDVKESNVDQKIHDDSEIGFKNALNCGVEDMELDVAGAYRDNLCSIVSQEEWLKTANVEDPIIKSWIECGKAVGAHESPLHLAAFYGRKRCVEYLLEKGADALLENFQGWLPIELAELGKNNDVVELLDKHVKSQIGV